MLKNLNDYLSLLVLIVIVFVTAKFFVGSIFNDDNKNVDKKSFRYIWNEFMKYSENRDE